LSKYILTVRPPREKWSDLNYVFYMKKNCNADEAINLVHGACSAASKGHRLVRWKRRKSLLLFCNAKRSQLARPVASASCNFCSDWRQSGHATEIAIPSKMTPKTLASCPKLRLAGCVRDAYAHLSARG